MAIFWYSTTHTLHIVKIQKRREREREQKYTQMKNKPKILEVKEMAELKNRTKHNYTICVHH